MIMQCFHGGWTDFQKLRLADINLEDVSHALSMLCRFNGHIKHFYSVAQHSVLMHDAVAKSHGPDDVAFACLMHDASEAYLGDDISPKKSSFPELRAAHEKLQERLYIKCGLAGYQDYLEDIHEADMGMLLAEAAYFDRDLSHERWRPIVEKYKPLEIQFSFWPMSLAEMEFKSRMDTHLKRKFR